MRILVVGAGGVGAAVAAIARRRTFFEHLALADLDPARAQAALDRIGRPDRMSAHAVDASDADAVAALARETRADAVLNACDPRLNPPIFAAAFDAGCHYLDMAMTLSERHPQRPYEEVGVKLGDAQFAEHERWEAAGRLALVGIGVEPGFSDVAARYAADHLYSSNRGVPQPAAHLGAGARVLHDRAVQRARAVSLPRGHRRDRVRQRRARGGRADAALGRRPARDVQVRAGRRVHRRAAHAAQARPRRHAADLGARRAGRAA
jgi:hypothetical protein